jgi:hypothetical protein
MATKRSLAEQILLTLNKRSASRNVDIREIILSVEQALANVIRVRYFEGKAEETGEINGALVNTFRDIPVLEDSELCAYYSEIPARTIDLPHGIDIRLVAAMKDTRRGYVEVPNGFEGLFAGLESYSLAGRIGFYRDGNRLYYVNMNYDKAPKSVVIKMVAGISSLGEDEQLNIPSDMEAQVIQYVVQLYGAMPQEDIVNDNVDQP